ncbi:MAG: nitroreductase family protein [Candidatus Thermoplasmatota archaeon]|nr:nitroreductase family protein [Candidatus Thermoplasmatota archaeon]
MNQRATLAQREPQAQRVHHRFVARRSPLAFQEKQIPEEDILAIFEAARWAPSSFNEQPWRFVYASSEAERARFLEAILEGNKVWAQNAPMLVFITAKTTFTRNGAPNDHAWFDAGAAWMSLALQARELGLDTHAMAGIDPERAADVIDLPADHEVIAAVAVGYRAPPETLPEELQERETSASPRKPLEEIAFEARFPST